MDLAPTLLELTGDSGPEGLGEHLDGSSLLGPGSAVVLGEYPAEGVTAPAVMVRRGRFKFVACPGDPGQLSDLSIDPAELVNLAADESRRGTVEEFRQEVARRWDLEELRERVLASQRKRHLIGSALERGAYSSWDFVPAVDASTRYVCSRADLYELQRRARLDVSPDCSS
jgi:choline-sulfatase